MSSEALEQRFADLQARLTALQDATTQLRELIDRLANFDFQPGSVPVGADDGEHVGSELGAEINLFLREQEEELELLEEEIVDSRPTKLGGGELQHDKSRLKDGVQRLKAELQSCRIYARKAQIAAKRNLQAAQKKERSLLYASFAAPPRSGASSPPAPDGTPQQQQTAHNAPTSRRHHRRTATATSLSKEEQSLGASHDVTLALRRTHDLMAAELSRSDFAHKTLRESTAALGSLGDTYAGLDGLLSRSRDLLGALARSQKSDTWYLETSFALLVATIGWLVFRRWVYGPAWWLVWWPLKLLFGAVFAVSRGVAGGSSSSSSSLVGEPAEKRGAGVLDTRAGAGGGGAHQSAKMNNEGVPTAQAGQEGRGPDQQRAQKDATGTDDLLEEVGRMIDESRHGELNGQDDPADETTTLRNRGEDEPPNPKKRMLEEEVPQHVEL